MRPQATLTLGTYVATEGKMMCKPCYMKGFLVKGNYSDGVAAVGSRCGQF